MTNHQIIVHVNEGSDDTIAWLQAQEIAYTHTPENVGICIAINMAYQLATNDYIMYMNDDMYCLPLWDKYIIDEIASIPHHNFMLSSTMIEPTFTGNKAAIHKSYGEDISSFDEEKILTEYDQLPHYDWSGSCWPPNVVHRSMWDKIGGYNELFSPGMSSDDDFAMRMWLHGCRIFKGISASRVYHFQCKSTGRVVKNNGRKTFLSLYGITQRVFHIFYLRRGEVYKGELKNPEFSLTYFLQKLTSKVKRMIQ